MSDTFPTLRSVVIDATDARALAEFYRQLLGYDYRHGDEPPPPGAPDPAGADWARSRRPGRDGTAGVPTRGAADALHVAGERRTSTTAPRLERGEQRRTGSAARASPVARGPPPARPLRRSRRAALRVRRSRRPPVLHLRRAFGVKWERMTEPSPGD